MEIQLPNYNWFVNSIAKKGKSGNPFTGSCGTNPVTGSVSSETADYSVLLKVQEDDSIVFVCECSRYNAWAAGKGREKAETRTEQFENSEESIEKIQAWLCETVNEYLK